jgi:hypothetical protein
MQVSRAIIRLIYNYLDFTTGKKAIAYGRISKKHYSSCANIGLALGLQKLKSIAIIG